MRFVLALLIAAPAVAAPAGPPTRSMPELSDLALAAMAAVGIWLVRRRLRTRARPPQD